MSAARRLRLPQPLHARAGLCDRCRHQKVIRNTRGSTFSMCRHPELPKYPHLPVLSCPRFEQRETNDDER